MKQIQNPPAKCSSKEVGIKSYFLGPQSENSDWLRLEIINVLDHWFQWRKDCFPNDGKAISREDQKTPEFQEQQKLMRDVLDELCSRFESEVPQFSPRYIGHMYSEISLPALVGHFIALLHNPNNISTEAARVGAFIEDEAIAALGQMLGFNKGHITGHFTSGGTVANIEGLWRARYRLDHFLSLGAYLNLHHNQKMSYIEAAHMGWEKYYCSIREFSIQEHELRAFSSVAQGPWQIAAIYRKAFGSEYQGPVVLVPNSKHYSWLKAVSLLGLGDSSFVPVELNSDGVLDINDLKKKWEFYSQQNRPIMMIVSIAGSTELGECDPIDRVQDFLDYLKQHHHIDIWHHVDAAYGGYFCAMNTLESDDEVQSLDPEVAKAFKALARVDSVTLDPHKLGYVPYACGAIVVPDDLRYRVSAFDASYIQSPNKTVDRWMKTLEGSRSAAGATATWMTSKTIGLNSSGYGKILARTIKARKDLERLITDHCPELRTLESTHLNLLCLVCKKDSSSLKEINKKTLKFVDHVNKTQEFFVSKTVLKSPEYKALIEHHAKRWNIEVDDNELVLLRMTLMNPFFTNRETTVSFPQELLKVFKRNIEIA